MHARYFLVPVTLFLVVAADCFDCNGNDQPVMTGTAASYQEEPAPVDPPAENPPPEGLPAEMPPPEDSPAESPQKGATQGVQVIETDIATFILNANPVCSEADKRLNGYAKQLTTTGCGKQVRLQSWTCTTTGEEGWTAEVYELEPCN